MKLYEVNMFYMHFASIKILCGIDNKNNIQFSRVTEIFVTATGINNAFWENNYLQFLHTSTH